MFRLQREEAKITAWENLQKAKAEAAIRKLEVRPAFSSSAIFTLFYWENMGRKHSEMLECYKKLLPLLVDFFSPTLHLNSKQ